jgi:hypothetical protein
VRAVALLRRLALAAALAATVVGAAMAHAAPPVATTTVAVTGCPADGVQVPNDYLGLSIEWSMVPHWFGTSRAGAVQPTVALLDSLEPASATPEAVPAEPAVSDTATVGILRIGGNSQDLHVWRPDGSTSNNKLFDGVITKGMVDALLAVAERSGWRLVLGLNLKMNRPADAVGLARYALTQDRTHRIVGVELGNEPTVLFGPDTPGYMARVYAYVQALEADPVTARVPIIGPSLANRTDLGPLTAWAQSYRDRAPFLTWHHYANRPSLTGLLSPAVEQEWADRIAAVQQAAGDVPTRMGEGNSVGTGGLNNVSNVMGASAWQVDAMLTAAAAGIRGYHAHAWDGYYFPSARPQPYHGPVVVGGKVVFRRESYYTPFVVRGGLVYPRPSFYAMALLRQLPGTRFCNAVTSAAEGSRVKTWTLIDPDTQHLLVYAVNKSDTDAAGQVTLTTPLRYGGKASVSRITDPAGCMGRKTDIEGSRLPTSGAYTWTPSTIEPTAGSLYSLQLDGCQSALIEIAPAAGQVPANSATSRTSRL